MRLVFVLLQAREGEQMEIVMRKTDELIPYVNNARKNDHAVDAVASSIKNYGFKQPIVIDGQGEVVAGHTRLKAAKKLGLKEVPVIVADDLTPAQVKAYRIADNRVGELAEWDMELLQLELDDIEGFTGFEDLGSNISNEDLYNDDENPYTTKVEVPNYEITGEKPKVSELVNQEKTNDLLKLVSTVNADKEIKEFLKLACYRHLTFDYSKIAEFYAHSDKETQEIMEKLILIIVDFNQAIESGFVTFIKEVYESQGDEIEETL